MQRLLFLFFFFFLFVVTPTTAKTLSKIAAVVNDDIITTHQLDQAVIEDLTTNSNKNQLDITQFQKMKVKTLNKLVDEKLMEQQIKKLELQVSDDELTSAIADVVLKNGLTDETLKQALAAQGVTMEQYREKVKKEILHYKLLSREVNYKVLVTSKEVRDYFDRHIAEYAGGAKLHLNQITYDLPDGDEKKIAKRRKRAEDCREQLISGEDFSEVIADQKGLASGADMGELAEADLSQPLQEALAGLKTGDVCEPLELDGKLYMFQVTSRDSDSDALFEQVRGQIESTLKKEKTDLRFKEWQKELHENARIEIRI